MVLWHAYQNSGLKDKEAFEKQDFERIFELIKKNESIEYTENIAKELFEKAEKIIESMDLKKDYQKEIIGYLKKIITNSSS